MVQEKGWEGEGGSGGGTLQCAAGCKTDRALRTHPGPALARPVGLYVFNVSMHSLPFLAVEVPAPASAYLGVACLPQATTVSLQEQRTSTVRKGRKYTHSTYYTHIHTNTHKHRHTCQA